MSSSSKYLPKADAFIKTLTWNLTTEADKLIESVVVGNIYGFAGYLDKQPYTEASTQEALLILDDVAATPGASDALLLAAIDAAIQKLRPVPAPVHDAQALAQLTDEQLGKAHDQVEPGSDAHCDIIMEHCNRGLTSSAITEAELMQHSGRNYQKMHNQEHIDYVRQLVGAPAPVVALGIPSNGPTKCSPLSCDGCPACYKAGEPAPTTPTELPMLEGGEGV